MKQSKIAWAARLLLLVLLALPAAAQGEFNFTTNNGTITITGYKCSDGVSRFTDPQWTDHPTRLYRVRPL